MSVDVDKICRTCLGLSGPLLSIYDGETTSCLAEMLKNFTRIQPNVSDNLPTKVCLSCIGEINRCYSFKMKCENSNKTLRQLIPDAMPEKTDALPTHIKPIEQCYKSTQTNPEPKVTQSVEVQTIEEELNNTLEIKIKTGSPRKRRKTQHVQFKESKNLHNSEVNNCAFTYESSNSGSSSTKRHLTTSTLEETVNEEYTEDCNNYEFESDEEDEFVVELQNDVQIQKEQNENAPFVLENMLVMPAITSDGSSVYKLKQGSNDVELQLQEYILDHDDTPSEDVVYIKTVVDNPVDPLNDQADEGGNGSNDTKQIRSEYKCVECSRTFVSKKVLRRHKLKFHAAECTKETSALTEALKVASVQTMKYSCSECSTGFSTKRALTIHHKKNVCQKLNFQCELCERFFETAEQLVSHKTDQHIGHQIECIECNQFFDNQEELSKHQVSKHKRKLRNQCDICKKVFTMMSTLKDHLRLHTGDKPFKCNICRKAFTQKSNLNQHLLRHEQTKTYKCELCFESFITKAELVSHQRRHSGIQPYKCEFCPSAFSSSSSLQKHRRRHTGERPYACDICPMRFSALNVLKNHRRLHTGEKPYKCEFCNKRFTQPGDCSIHMKKHMLGAELNSQSYDCICGKQYPILSRLLIHQKTCPIFKKETDESNDNMETNESKKTLDDSDTQNIQKLIELNLDKMCEEDS